MYDQQQKVICVMKLQAIIFINIIDDPSSLEEWRKCKQSDKKFSTNQKICYDQKLWSLLWPKQ